MISVASAVVTAHPVQTVLVYQMVTAGKVTVAVLLQRTPVMSVMTVLVFQMVRTLIRVVDVEYMISCQQMAVMIYVVLH